MSVARRALPWGASRATHRTSATCLHIPEQPPALRGPIRRAATQKRTNQGKGPDAARGQLVPLLMAMAMALRARVAGAHYALASANAKRQRKSGTFCWGDFHLGSPGRGDRQSPILVRRRYNEWWPCGMVRAVRIRPRGTPFCLGGLLLIVEALYPLDGFLCPKLRFGQGYLFGLV